jgi:hypothetical protein
MYRGAARGGDSHFRHKGERGIAFLLKGSAVALGWPLVAVWLMLLATPAIKDWLIAPR